jgi:hypothetical protein
MKVATAAAVPRIATFAAETAQSAHIAREATRIMDGVEWLSEAYAPIMGFASSTAHVFVATAFSRLGVGEMMLASEDQGTLSDFIRAQASDARECAANAESVVDREFAERDAIAWLRLGQYLANHLSDVRVMKWGPVDARGALVQGRGLFVYTIAGSTKDGGIAGVRFFSAEI